MANDLHTLPQAERFLSGTLQEAINESVTEVEVSNPPSDLPTYIEIDPDSDSLKELTRVTGVTGNTITIERGLNNGGVGFPHSSLAPYKQNFTSLHYKKVVDAIESGYLTEDTSYLFTRVSTSSFKVTASGVDRTARYTAGRRLRLNGSVEVAVVSSSYSNPDTTVIVNTTTVPSTITSIEMEIGTDERFNIMSELKATGAEINTGTEDAKIVTPKAIADSYIGENNNSLYRQALINPGGNNTSQVVNQRAGTSGTTANDWANHKSYYTADRWCIYASDTSNVTGTVNADGSIQTSKNTGAGTPKIATMQILEANNSYALRGKTLSFGVIFDDYGTAVDMTVFVLAMKAAGTADTVSAAPISDFGADGTRPTFNTTDYDVLYEADVDSANLDGTTRITGTTTSVPADAKNIIFGVVNKESLKTGDNYGGYKFKQVVLCAGDVALPFMPKSYEDELRACQRYCYVPATPSAYSFIAQGSGASATRVLVFVKMPVTMRTSPTLTATVADWQMSDYAGAPFDLSNITINTTEVTPDNVPLNCDVGSGITAYRSYQLVSDNNANRIMIFSAEL